MSWISDKIKKNIGGNNIIETIINPGYGAGNWLYDKGKGLMEGPGYEEKTDKPNYEWHEKQWEKQKEVQYDFAKHGLGWMLDDAKSRGLSPMAAIGGSAPRYNPVSIPLPQNRTTYVPKGQKSARFGEALQRAQVALSLASMVAQIKSVGAQTNYYNARAESLGREGTMGVSGDMVKGAVRNPIPSVVVEPVVTKARAKGKYSGLNKTQQAGSMPSYAYRRTHMGLKQMASDEANARLMGNPTEMASWAIYEGLRTMLFGKGQDEAPSKKEHPLPKGYVWKYNRNVHQWMPFRNKFKRFYSYSFFK